MEKPILSDKEQFPTDEVIFTHIGNSKKRWEKLFDFISSNYPEFEEQWSYYNDGKSWLMKVVRKKKTIFWLSIIKNSFRTTFYFGDKAETAILESNISDELKDSFKNGKRYGKIRGITIEIKNGTALENVYKLIDIKLKLK
ncbi:MAG: DUF3788 domain-containing protein [Melioribacteraceae bacterium]|nr:DUF3788 domain-containing protein [Melioribacteraceae bacterium]